MTKAWLKSNGDIPTVLHTLFRSPEFWSRSTYRAKIKTPLEFVVSAARAASGACRGFTARGSSAAAAAAAFGSRAAGHALVDLANPG